MLVIINRLFIYSVFVILIVCLSLCIVCFCTHITLYLLTLFGLSTFFLLFWWITHPVLSLKIHEIQVFFSFFISNVLKPISFQNLGPPQWAVPPPGTSDPPHSGTPDYLAHILGMFPLQGWELLLLNTSGWKLQICPHRLAWTAIFISNSQIGFVPQNSVDVFLIG